MNKTSSLLSLTALLLAGPSGAATVSVSSTAPVVDGDDIANDVGGADLGGDQGHMWNNRPTQGQSFTTGAAPAGYLLNSVTLKNLNNTVTASPTFSVTVGSLSGSTLTQIGSTETGVAPSYSPGAYLTFAFDTPLTLSPNTSYAFLWGSSGQGFVTTNTADNSTYSGGTAISSGTNSVPDPGNVLSRAGDRVFHVDLSAVPEPSTSILGLAALAALLRRKRS